MVLDLRKPGYGNGANAPSRADNQWKRPAMGGKDADVEARVHVEVPPVGSELAADVVRGVAVPFRHCGFTEQPRVVVGRRARQRCVEETLTVAPNRYRNREVLRERRGSQPRSELPGDIVVEVGEDQP